MTRSSYISLTLLWHKSYSTVTWMWHCCDMNVALPWHCCDKTVTPVLHYCDTSVALVWHCKDPESLLSFTTIVKCSAKDKLWPVTCEPCVHLWVSHTYYNHMALYTCVYMWIRMHTVIIWRWQVAWHMKMCKYNKSEGVECKYDK